MNDAAYGEFVAFAEGLAETSGEILRRYFRAPFEIDDKPDASPVTPADREAESRMREIIAATYPEHGVCGEEFAPVRLDAEFVWMIDPLDGTKSFITGKPLFGTLIGLLHRGRPVVGIIDHPALGERWVGGVGQPTAFNGARVGVRACASLAKAVLYTTTYETFEGADREAFDRARKAVRLPMYGGDCYAYGLIASGFVDLIIETDHGPDDFFPLVPVIENAGGLMTDWLGAALTMESDGRVVAAGDEKVHAEALALLNGEHAP
ncbi:MAG: histidinol-phosphatase [Alphaproteobacteria bacterium]